MTTGGITSAVCANPALVLSSFFLAVLTPASSTFESLPFDRAEACDPELARSVCACWIRPASRDDSPLVASPSIKVAKVPSGSVLKEGRAAGPKLEKLEDGGETWMTAATFTLRLTQLDHQPADAALHTLTLLSPVQN